MDTSEQINLGRRKCLTAECRELDPPHRALKLINENFCSERTASQVVQMTRSQLRRAKDAIKSGREIGRNGNPPIFNEEEEQECYNYVRSVLPENTYFSDEEFRKEVCSQRIQRCMS